SAKRAEEPVGAGRTFVVHVWASDVCRSERTKQQEAEKNYENCASHRASALPGASSRPMRGRYALSKSQLQTQKQFPARILCVSFPKQKIRDCSDSRWAAACRDSNRCQTHDFPQEEKPGSCLSATG